MSYSSAEASVAIPEDENEGHRCAQEEGGSQEMHKHVHEKNRRFRSWRHSTAAGLRSKTAYRVEVRPQPALLLALHAAAADWTAGLLLALRDDGRLPLLGNDATSAADVSRDAREGLVHPLASFRGCLEEEEPVPLGEGGALFRRDRALWEVALVRDERDRHAGEGPTNIRQPSRHVLECVALGNVVYQECTGRPSEVGARRGEEQVTERSGSRARHGTERSGVPAA